MKQNYYSRNWVYKYNVRNNLWSAVLRHLVTEEQLDVNSNSETESEELTDPSWFQLWEEALPYGRINDLFIHVLLFESQIKLESLH